MNKKHQNKSGILAAKLKELRLAHGYKQADIAAAIDIKQATYSNYEIGKRTPSTVMIYRIANFYGMPADDLLKMCIPLDEEIYYEAPAPTEKAREERDFLAYMESKTPPHIAREERELLWYFSRLTLAGKQEIIDFAVFKRQQENRSTAR